MLALAAQECAALRNDALQGLRANDALRCNPVVQSMHALKLQEWWLLGRAMRGCSWTTAR
jgi:hypothetical protein